ncbi:hypothetical protein GCM10022275_24080 [Tessaracoccus defluvii]
MRSLTRVGWVAQAATLLAAGISLFPTWRMVLGESTLLDVRWMSGFTFTYAAWGALLLSLGLLVVSCSVLLRVLLRKPVVGAWPWVLLLALGLTLVLPWVGITDISYPTPWGWVGLAISACAVVFWFSHWRQVRLTLPLRNYPHT